MNKSCYDANRIIQHLVLFLFDFGLCAMILVR